MVPAWWHLTACLLLAPQLPDDVVSQFADEQWAYTGGDYQAHAFHYRLLAPPQVESGKTYPLVLFLHGAGERGDDNRSQLLYLPAQMVEPEWRERFPCYLLAPQCPRGKWWTGLAPPAKLEGDQPAPLNDELTAVTQMLEATWEKLPIDRHRVYLTGLSMGGFGSWHLAAVHPEWFAAVVPICGGGDARTAPRLAKLPIWAFHGGADPVVPVARTRQIIEAVRAAGGDPKYTELEGVGHDSWTPAYRQPDGVLEWMFEQTKP